MAGGELECNELESSQNHHAPPHSVEKLSSTKLVSGAKKVGDHCSRGLNIALFQLNPFQGEGSMR